MTRIDFYQVDGDETEFACRLIDKVYRRGYRIYVHTAGETQAMLVDEQLWIFRHESFVPHALQQSGDTAPVTIGFNHEAFDQEAFDQEAFDQRQGEHQDVLINLSGEVPDFFSRFDRVAEVVPADEKSRDAARRNYGFYKDRGYSLNYHKM